MQQVEPQELKKWLEEGRDLLLVDVREDFERELFHIGGLHIPLGELMSRRHELPAGKSVVFYCEKGIRSAIAIQRLEALGHAGLVNLAGGMKAWKAGV